MVDKRCYERLPDYWGKIGVGQSRLILDEIVSLPEGEHTVLHIGCGHWTIEELRDGLEDWLRCIYYAQFNGDRIQRIDPLNRPRTGSYPTIVRRLNYILSDREPSSMFTMFNGVMPDPRDDDGWVETGHQEFRVIDAKNIDINDESIEIVIALGFFSNKVLRDEDLGIILREIHRILKQNGKLLTSVHEHYVAKLIQMSEDLDFQVNVLDVSKDLGPQNKSDIKTRSLISFIKE